jgi:hypothetical protein
MEDECSQLCKIQLAQSTLLVLIPWDSWLVGVFKHAPLAVMILKYLLMFLAPISCVTLRALSLSAHLLAYQSV